MRHRQLRTWLTMIGIFIGIAAVVSLISLGQGMQEAINNQFSTFGVDKIIVTAKSAGFGPPGTLSAGQVEKSDLAVLKKVPGVKRVAGRLLKPVKVEFSDEVRTLYAASLPDDTEEYELIKEVNSLRAMDGRLLKQGDKRKVMVGHDLAAKLLFSRQIKTGSKLLLNGKLYTVIGVVDKLGDPGRDNALYLMEQDMRSLVEVKEEYSALIVQAGKGENPKVVADHVKRTLQRHRHQKTGKEDFEIQTAEEILRQLNTILQVVSAVLSGIAAISLLVGGIGIMNTMYTAVLERTRDIGIMKAIGAQNKEIMLIFLIEAGLLGMAGGLVGVLLGVGLAKIVEVIAAAMWGPNLLKASLSWILLAGALLFSFLVGTISGLLPAKQASSLKPSLALQYE